MNDETVYTALGKTYRCGEAEFPVAAACELLGSGVTHYCTDRFTSMEFSGLHSLIRFISVCHGSGLREDNQNLWSKVECCALYGTGVAQENEPPHNLPDGIAAKVPG